MNTISSSISNQNCVFFTTLTSFLSKLSSIWCKQIKELKLLRIMPFVISNFSCTHFSSKIKCLNPLWICREVHQLFKRRMSEKHVEINIQKFWLVMHTNVTYTLNLRNNIESISSYLDETFEGCYFYILHINVKLQLR